jgi:hypothetical protein
MNRKPLVSTVIPFFNEEKFLPGAAAHGIKPINDMELYEG